MRPQTVKRICLYLIICIGLILQIGCFSSCGNVRQTDTNNTTTNTSNNTYVSVSTGEHTENPPTVNTFGVRFLTNDGIPIRITECKSGEALTPPTPPKKIGYVFVGWSGDYNNITQDTDIVANYVEVSKIKNVISADTVYISGTSEFNVVIGIYGNVEFCGLDMEIAYDTNLLDLVSSEDVDDSVILNDSTDGIIYMNYVTTNNTKGEVEFVTLKFKLKVALKNETSLQMAVNSMYSLDNNNAFVQSEYQVLQNKIIIEEAHDEK